VHGRQAAHPENYFGKTGMVAVPLLNFAALEMLSTQIRQICGNKTSIDAKFYRFVSGFAITLRGGDGGFRKFLVIRNLRICGAAVEMLLVLVTIITSQVCYEITICHTFTFYCRRWMLREVSMPRLSTSRGANFRTNPLRRSMHRPFTIRPSHLPASMLEALADLTRCGTYLHMS
jgi:hypothetical protein